LRFSVLTHETTGHGGRRDGRRSQFSELIRDAAVGRVLPVLLAVCDRRDPFSASERFVVADGLVAVRRASLSMAAQ